RTLRRGHVTARGLARELARLWDIPAAELLERTRRTDRQRALPARERRGNVRGVFAAPRPVPRTVCLVDDVYTTGSTANACASALRRQGADTVWVVTLARAVR
ncbi:MAG: ComF family protein, partial [Actinobacteria bacterium]|nr:ComF family protein [Actinomycetota bacterium]